MEKTKKLLDVLQLKFPVVQAPMLGVTSPQMVAEICNAGGLGSLPVGGLSPARTKELIHETKRLTSKNFAVNLFAHDVPREINLSAYQEMQSFLKGFCAAHQIPFEEKNSEDFVYYSYLDQLEVLLEEQIRVVSFTFGLPAAGMVSALKDNGSLLIGTATSVLEAVTLAAAGLDMVTAQGMEAGGHRGSFLNTDPAQQVGSLSLIPQIADAVSIPVLAAGGISDNRTLKAALSLGAAGVQVGSLFIPASESLAAAGYKKMVMEARDTDSSLTAAFSGRWARGIRNLFKDAVENSGLQVPEYVVQNGLTAGIRAYAQKNNLTDFISMWAGQSSSMAKAAPSAEILAGLVKEGW